MEMISICWRTDQSNHIAIEHPEPWWADGGAFLSVQFCFFAQHRESARDQARRRPGPLPHRRGYLLHHERPAGSSRLLANEAELDAYRNATLNLPTDAFWDVLSNLLLLIGGQQMEIISIYLRRSRGEQGAFARAI